MNARLITGFKSGASVFNYDGCMQYVERIVDIPYDIYAWDDLNNSIYTDTYNLCCEITCVMKDLEFEGIKERDPVKPLTRQQIRYNKKKEAKLKKERKEMYKEMTDLEAKDLEDERNILKTWLDEMSSLSPECFMRPNVKDGHYDGNTYDTISGETEEIDIWTARRMNKKEDKIMKMCSLKPFDTEFRQEQEKKGKGNVTINVKRMMEYLASFQEIREMIYMNRYRIRVRAPKFNNYPEDKMLSNIADILIAGINTYHNDSKVSCFQRYDENITGKLPTLRNDLMLIWSSAPEDSVLGKAWASLKDLKYGDMNQVIEWQKDKASFDKTDIAEEFYYEVKLRKELRERMMYLTA